MKRLILLLITIISLNFIGCGGGGGSSKEAKELLQKILQVVGIPQEIVVNICQDSNENGVCEDFELQTKVTINRGDSFSDIWQKIKLTEDGKYFLTTRDITKPILLELQDSANVTYDNGKFTLPFSGFKTHENNETKELSILASMVDKNYFTDSELYSIRHLNNKDTQDKFYAKLLKALEDNINTLRGVGLNPQDAMSANLKEMATQLIADGIKDTLPQDLNRCGADGECVDRRLDTLSTHITISNERAESIKSERDNSATPTPTSTNNKKGPLVSKEVKVEKGEYEETKTTITFEYNSKNQIIKDIKTTITTYHTGEKHNSKEICTYNYDNKDRYIGEDCSETTTYSNGESETTNSNTDVIYKDNKIDKWLYYDNNGHLSESWEALEWSGNKPIKWKTISYNSETGEEVDTSTWSSTYTNNNPTHLEGKNKYSSWSIDRRFDNKLNPYYYSWQQEIYYWFGWFGKNNIIEETWTTTSKRDSENYSSTKNTKNSITYNSYNMPTRIDTTETSSYNGNNSYTTTSYTTYEYIEPK